MKTVLAIVVLTSAFMLCVIATRAKPTHSAKHAPRIARLRHTPEKQSAASSAPRVSKKRGAVTLEQDLSSMSLNKYPPVTYRFEGKTTCDNIPCRSAQITVRVITGSRAQTQAGVTNIDGTYSVPVTVSVPLYTPLEWTVEAHTSDYQQIELTGRRIVTEKDKEEGRATLETALALL